MLPLTDSQICNKPPPELVKAVRDRHGFTQLQCCIIVGCSIRTWQRYELKGGMEIGVWWCFLLRIAEVLPSQLPPIPQRSRAGIMVHIIPSSPA